MRWVNKAPVFEVSDEEFEELARRFIEDLRENWTVKPAVLTALQSAVKTKYRKKKDWAIRDALIEENKELFSNWNKRVENSKTEADIYSREGRKFAYLLNGRAAALMRVTVKADSLRVEDLSAHPGTQGAGEIMMERAVNVSEECGKGGVVTLYAAGGSEGFYAKLGLESVDDANLRLRPSDANGWVRLSDGKWRLKKYPENTPYLADPFNAPKEADGQA
jgi:hypothetical protein